MNDTTEHAQPRTSDPERIRALAHPLRLRLLDLLDEHGELTATECAQLTGEGVPACSFHLRMLAKYGYIEAGTRRGRDKPWRTAAASHGSFLPDLDDTASVRAVEALATLMVDREAERIRDWVGAVGSEDPAWVAAATIRKASFWATADELADLSRQIQSLTDRFADRWADPSARPPGARPARLFAVLNPDRHTAAAQPAPRRDGARS
jgi:DNA-binding transcriptional ArsR family regulator